MMALGWMNIGAAVAPDTALASVVSSILVIVGHHMKIDIEEAKKTGGGSAVKGDDIDDSDLM